MSRATSRGTAGVSELCEAFEISRQAYYAARRRIEESAGPGAASPPAPTPGGFVTSHDHDPGGFSRS